jgi:hypothetical protein
MFLFQFCLQFYVFLFESIDSLTRIASNRRKDDQGDTSYVQSCHRKYLKN